MIENHSQLEAKEANLIQALTEASIKKDPVDRLSIVEALKDIKGRNSLASLWGISPERMIIRQKTKDWIYSRKNQGLKQLENLKDIDLARDIFKAWDTEDKGYLTL